MESKAKENDFRPNEEKKLKEYLAEAHTGDESLMLSDELSFQWYDPLIVVYSIVSYIVDTGLDIAVAVSLYQEDQMWYCGLTIAFIVIPTLTMTIFSLRWYIADAKIPESPNPTALVWTLRIVLLLLQLGPVLRYLDMLRFGLKYKRAKDPEEKKKYYNWMVYEDADAALLRLFEAFMEAAPQLVLQIYILAKLSGEQDPYTVTVQVGSCAISLISISWALASQQRAMRISMPENNTPSWPASITQALWYLFVTCSRMLTLGLFASLFPITLAIVCGIRLIVMTLWLQTMHSEFSDSKVENIFYKCVLGVVFLFCYFNPEPSPTRWRYSLYYLYTFVENSILIGYWFNYVDHDLWYRLPAVYAVFLTFFIGIILMVIYYLLLHPSGKIKVDNWQLSCWNRRDTGLENEDKTGRESPSFVWENGNTMSPAHALGNDHRDNGSKNSSESLDSEFNFVTDYQSPQKTTRIEEENAKLLSIRKISDSEIGTPV